MTTQHVSIGHNYTNWGNGHKASQKRNYPMENLPSHSGYYKIVKEEHDMEALKAVRQYVNITDCQNT